MKALYPPTTFRALRPEDDAEVRRLLHSAPMDGAIRLRLTQDPSYFAATGIGGAEETLLVAHQAGRLVALGRCTVQDRFVHGQPRRCGYLAHLRLAPDAVSRGALVRDGFRAFAAALASRPAELYFTSILDDNTRARSVLEHRRAGLPVYTRVGGYTTFVLNAPGPRAAPLLRERAETALARAGFRVVSGASLGPAGLADALNRLARAHPLALVWSEALLDRLSAHGLGGGDFSLLQEGTRCVAAFALWDQRAFRQITVDGYQSPLGLLRHAYNAYATLSRLPRLPPPGGTLRQAFISPLLGTAHATGALPAWVDYARAQAGERGLHYVVLGHGTGDAARDRAFGALRARRTASTLYRVTWDFEPSAGGPAPALPWDPEVALL